MKSKKVWIISFWQDDFEGNGHWYVAKVFDNEEKAKSYYNSYNPMYTDMEEFDIDKD